MFIELSLLKVKLTGALVQWLKLPAIHTVFMEPRAVTLVHKLHNIDRYLGGGGLHLVRPSFRKFKKNYNPNFSSFKVGSVLFLTLSC